MCWCFSTQNDNCICATHCRRSGEKNINSVLHWSTGAFTLGETTGPAWSLTLRWGLAVCMGHPAVRSKCRFIMLRCETWGVTEKQQTRRENILSMEFTRVCRMVRMASVILITPVHLTCMSLSSHSHLLCCYVSVTHLENYTSIKYNQTALPTAHFQSALSVHKQDESGFTAITMWQESCQHFHLFSAKVHCWFHRK